MQIDAVDLPIVVPQNFDHRDRLGILFDDDLRQQIEDQHEHHCPEYQEQIHHAAHRANQLTGSLCQIVYCDLCGNQGIVNVLDLLVREVGVKVIAVVIERLTEQILFHKDGNGGRIIVDAADLKLVLVAAIGVFQGYGVTLFHAVLFCIGSGNIYFFSGRVQLDIVAVRLYAVQGNAFTAAFLRQGVQTAEAEFFCPAGFCFCRCFQNILICRKHIVGNGILIMCQHRL